ncbi:MAG: amino acid adenylation domain-containing protein, partial [bacterium]|nr:amino acid adenylation domain-containing protein [bacterium]
MKKDNSADIEDILGLTPMQEGLLFHYMSDPSGNYYYEQLCLDIAGEIDLQYVEQAWNRVIRQNEMLRAVFRWEKVKQPVQLIRKTHRIRIRTNDLSTKTPGERKQLLEVIETTDRQKGFDLRDVPFRVTLVRTGRDTFRMIIGSHHILYDGWSSALILGEFFDAYAHLTTGFTPVIPVKTKFKDYVKWLREQETPGSAGYWKEYLSGIQCSTGLSIKEKTFLNEGGGSYFIEFPPGDTAVIGDFLKSNKLTLAVLFYSAWGILLRQYNNTRDTGDVVTGTTVSGRSVPIEGIEHTVGLFINTLPLRIRTRSGESGLQLLRRTAEALRARQPYESTPLVKIREYSGLAAREALFDTIVVIENYPLDISVMPANRGLSVTSYTMLESTHYDVTVRVENIDGIKVDFSYSADVPGEAIVRLAGHFQRIVQGLITNPEDPERTIDMLSREERRQILVDFNDTGVSFPEDKTIHQLFEEQAARTPDRVALIEYRSYMTYNQLDKISNRLARQLFEKGVGPGTAVAVMEGRSIEMMVRIFAILKAGAAYLPIDPGYPPNRIRYMLQDSNAWVLMSEVDRLSELRGEGTTHLTHLTHPTHLGYIIYTSGSSGRPRGVMVEHRSLVNRLTWMQKNYPLGAGDVILQKTPITFDVSVWELFWWGIAGASLCLLAPGGEKDPAVIIETVERDRVTVMHFVPSMLQAMLEYIEMGGSASRLSGLRRVFASGESLSPSQVKRFNRLFQARLTNLYGPTEATIDVSYYNCYGPGHTHPDTIPIGKPIDNVKLYILDKYLKLQPIGIPGELYISGTGVARGYLNRPELTGENFNKSYKSYRTYKTGDLARWLSDGNIQFLGRLDHQVKVRGFR